MLEAVILHSNVIKNLGLMGMIIKGESNWRIV